ncbi:glutamate-ammonia-ligase adenylyltransferase [Arenicella chitinivorans]|uniref:Glutamate-ammonia-ligase adenylyltransferase n=1 Tax=Arenicella chitinivorans TaxID=1329800 RepID=A0A918RR92_9GAMM|nr:hypothetical protein [Arenicella chitinivorans]GHA07941.1 glutamate-ammonia-ligase adenylyltransferase [Arenicella chitinivorans]
MASLAARVAASPYLSRLGARCALSTPKDASVLEAAQEVVFDALRAPVADELDAAEATLLLRKSEFSWLWAHAELAGWQTPEERGRRWTQFAELSIDYALRLAWLRVANEHKQVQDVALRTDGRVPGLFILGMGKLGGGDLNFSSDVDLVGYFDPDVVPVPEVLGKSYVCHRVLQELTRILTQGETHDFVWRVDWRLRPNASATTLAMSSHAAEEYYFYRASPWHRLAMMKARVVAGDVDIGTQFLTDMTPFIWRQNLDYRALDELAEIKQRINLEHPALRSQRQWREPIVEEIGGFNVKLGTGGIREIEFKVNALQLIWGGRRRELRVTNTVQALRVLAQCDQIPEADAEALIGGYQTLRRIENAIQLLGNQQTHLIPSDGTRQQQLLTLLGIHDWSTLVADLNAVRQLVSRHFTELFTDRAAEDNDPIVWPEGLSAQADGIVEAWESGYHLYGVSNQVRHRLVPLTRGIANYLAEQNSHSGQDPSVTVVRLHDFFRALPSGEQYFRLLAESPALLRSIVPPLLYSPAMTSLLKQSPHIIDCYVQGDWRYPEPFESEYVLQAESYEGQLERMRRFVNEHLYQLYLRFLQGEIAVIEFQTALTQLAEHSIQLAMQAVRVNMGLDSVPVAVIGMGKMGMRRMSPMSDLDLIFVFDQQAASLDQASRFVSRLQTAISTPMREGILYELDTRLRPSGKSGAPTVSIDSYATHHMERAHTWEHIALVPSRVVHGAPEISARINQLKADVLTRPRDEAQFLRDALKMWARISEHRIDDTALHDMNSKLRVGGLMQAEYLASCLVLKHGSRLSASGMEFDVLLANALKESGLEELPEVIQFWRIQQLWERLLGKTDQPISSLRDQYFSRLLEHLEMGSMDELIVYKKHCIELVENGLNELFTGLDQSADAIDAWLEHRVSWV